MGKAEASVEELVRKIERGELGLPEMQRQYVWQAPRVRDLFDSLYRGYPSGAILLWETDEDVPLREFAVSQQTTGFQRRQLLLDGQQRLTSLSALIRGEPVTVRYRKKPIDLLFNLDHPDDVVVTEVEEEGEEPNSESNDDEHPEPDEVDSNADELEGRIERMTFVVSTRKLEQRPNWIRVSEVFKTDEDAPFLSRAGVERIDDPRYTKYSQRLARLRGIRSYMYRMDVLEPSLSYDEVTEIFVRVNSLGAKLRSSDLALAQITAKWRNSLELFQAFQDQCRSSGFDLDLGILLRSVVVFGTGQSRFQAVSRLNLEKLQESWRSSCRGIEFAMSFLKSNVGIHSPALLSSPYLVISTAYFCHTCDYELDPTTARELRRWILLANTKGRYSRGSSESLLDQDLADIRTGAGPLECWSASEAKSAGSRCFPATLLGAISRVRCSRRCSWPSGTLAPATGHRTWRSRSITAERRTSCSSTTSFRRRCFAGSTGRLAKPTTSRISHSSAAAQTVPSATLSPRTTSPTC